MTEYHNGYELNDGRLVKKPRPNSEHSYISLRLLRAYYRFDPDEQFGIMLQEISIAAGEKHRPAPDLAWWRANRKPAPERKSAPLPDLAIEVWSPEDFDTKAGLEAARQKLRNYLEAGVTLAWGINPKNKTVEVYRIGEVKPTILSLSAELDGENVIPSFRLEVSKLFE